MGTGVLQKNPMTTAIKPLVANQLGVEEALQKGPRCRLRGFMQKKNVREEGSETVSWDSVGRGRRRATPEEENVALRILVPAFMISELKRRAFEIGLFVVPARS